MARNFTIQGDREWEDSFGLPQGSKRLLLSSPRSNCRRKDGRVKKLFIDTKESCLHSRCESELFIELPEEARAANGKSGKLNFWLYVFRQAAQAWENLYAEKSTDAEFVRGTGSSLAFYHTGTCRVQYTESISSLVALMRT